jgi:Xaa-Pro aminopeptidase
MVKSPEEIAVFTRAGWVMEQLPEMVRRAFRPGMTELELSAALEFGLRLQGHGTLFRCRREGVEMSAYGVCAAGERTLAGTKFEGVCGGAGLSPAVPYGASAAVIERGAPIVIDFGFVLEGYILDQTRMACWGEPRPEVSRAFHAMRVVQQAILDAMQPGTLWEEVYRVAISMAAAQGYADVFMGVDHEQVKFVGHGVGLEIDEPPFLAPKMPYPLEAGMVVAVEPKVALPAIGVVGIEDTVVIRAAGPEFLTVCPQEMIVLE